MGFFKHYGLGKVKEAQQALNDAIVSWDPEGATEAAIEEMEENFDKVNREFSKAKQEWAREQKEADEINALYEKRLKTAELLSAKSDAAPSNTQLTDALNQLLTQLEEMQPDIEREVEEAEDAKAVMDDLQETVNMYATKLKNARATMKSAARAMERAKRQEERAEEKARRAEEQAGLRASVGGMSSALDAMNRQAADAQARADAANRKAKLLSPTKVEENDIIKEAMAEVSGESPAPTSVKDRLAALKR